MGAIDVTGIYGISIPSQLNFTADVEVKSYHCLNLLLCDHISIPDFQVSFEEAQVEATLREIAPLHMLSSCSNYFAVKNETCCSSEGLKCCNV